MDTDGKRKPTFRVAVSSLAEGGIPCKQTILLHRFCDATFARIRDFPIEHT